VLDGLSQVGGCVGSGGRYACAELVLFAFPKKIQKKQSTAKAYKRNSKAKAKVKSKAKAESKQGGKKRRKRN
jgi:hypothetical protein